MRTHWLLMLLLWAGIVTDLSGQIKLPSLKGVLGKPDKPVVSDTSDLGKVLQYLEERSPVSTNFDNAIYESEVMADFEPAPDQYLPLELQPTAEKGGFKLRSGLYTMMAKSFCLKAGTYGPSRGDGHLYAPLAGRKREMVETILERYAKHPEIPQQKIQVLLWAIIARADVHNLLKSEHFISLKKLFTLAELGKMIVVDIANQEIDNKINVLDSKMPPIVKKALHAEQEIQNLITSNPIYERLEQVAVLAGIAPAQDMIREVSRGRWSYHPDGYFVRFFPHGYQRTRVDVYVPNTGNVELDASGNQVLSHNARAQGESKEVVFNPAKMVAVPANRSSQRIGVSPVPSEPVGNYKIKFYAYPPCTEVVKSDGLRHNSFSGHIYVGFFENDKLKIIKGFGPDGKSFWDASNLSEETHLVRFAKKTFEVTVNKIDYENALSINKNGYFIGINDCVSYADNVADAVKLKTPSTTDFVLTPMGFLEYLIDHNSNSNNASNPEGFKKYFIQFAALWNPENRESASLSKVQSDYKVKFFAFPPCSDVEYSDGDKYTSPVGHIFVGFFEKNKLRIVKGFTPDGKSFFEASELSEQSHLVKFASRTFEVQVTKADYDKAMKISKNSYVLLINDCVSYAVDVAESINIKTPSFTDFVLTPMGFLDYLISNN